MIAARRRTSSALTLSALALSTVALLGAAGCSADGSNSQFGGGGSGGSGTTAQTGTGTGGDSSSSGVGGDFNPAGTGGNTGAGGEENCAATTVQAELVPVNMFIAVDKSGSMSGSKWDGAEQAFGSFFKDPAAADLKVALRFWPNGECDDTGFGNCDDSLPACMTPDVPLGPLSDPAHQQALIDMFASLDPTGGTPMYEALHGATKWAAFHQVQNPNEKTVVLLVTDGEPNGCIDDTAQIAQLAEIAYQGAKVLTFAVGIELSQSGQQVLNAIAASGQTGQPFLIQNGNAQNLLAALKQIEQSAVACQFKMPESTTPGEMIDPTKVNVTYTPSAPGSMPVTIKQVIGSLACNMAGGGWYYDNADMPTTIYLCPQTCNIVQADIGAKIDVQLGCATIIN